MPANFYDMQKYAATGIASAGMTDFDKLRARALFPQSYPSITVTGIPPLSFKANGKPLASWSISGNSRQTGTPVYPEFVGNRTEQLLSCTIEPGSIAGATGENIDGEALGWRLRTSDFTLLAAGTYTISMKDAEQYVGFYFTYDATTGTYVERLPSDWTSFPLTFTLQSTQKVKFIFRSVDDASPITPSDISDVMLNTGSTAKPYQPYGIYLPVSCGSQITPIYLGQTQTVRQIKKLVLTGNETGWTDATVGGNHFFLSPVLSDGAVIYIGTLSTHYAPSNASGAQRPDNSIRQVVYLSAYSQLSIRDDACATLTDFKTFLQQQYSAGTPVTVWYVLANDQTSIVNEPLCKIGDYADTVASTNTGAPSIPTVRGSNTLTVDTDLQPSSVTITT